MPDATTAPEALLARMTLREKIGQLNMYTDFADKTGPEAAWMDVDQRRRDIREGRVGSMLNVASARMAHQMQTLALESRLAIPLVFGYDVIHGLRTVFPAPLGEAATWDPALAEACARHAAREAAAAGINWTFGPNVDIGYDQRWGRVMEGAGECPHLGAAFAAARVRGFQGDDLAAPDTIAACAKHLAGYGFAEAGRDYNTVVMGDYTLHNEVLPPFRAAVDAGVATVMNGFHLLDGLPVTANRFLQRTWLKEGLGWPGVVVSDWNSIGEMEAHGITGDRAAASAIALRAGCDIDMESGGYHRYLADLVERGEVDEALVDEACLRVLRLKARLGLFDDPFRYCDVEADPDRERRVAGSPEARAAARAAAAASCVLLRNEGQLLPLAARPGLRVAVVGELAAETDSPLGSWRPAAPPASAASLLQGIAEAFGYTLAAGDAAGAMPIPAAGDFRAEVPTSTTFPLDAMRPPATADGAVEVRYARGPALLRPDSRRSFTHRMYLNDDDETGLAEAVALAEWADVVVLAVGEHGFMSGEARSRTDIRLPRLQRVLAEAVTEANPDTVAVLYHGRALAIPELAERCRAVVCAWQPGTEGGRGVADILTGATEPRGRLPVSFPHVTGQCPLGYRRFATGRPDPLGGDSVWWSHYEDAPNGALFPFGFGLGYTRFAVSGVRLSAKRMTRTQTITLAADVANVGERRGSTVVQLYLRDPSASRARPVRELKGFERVELDAGATATVGFEVDGDLLAFWTPEEGWHAEAGTFELYAALDSADLGEAALLELAP